MVCIQGLCCALALVALARPAPARAEGVTEGTLGTVAALRGDVEPVGGHSRSKRELGVVSQPQRANEQPFMFAFGLSLSWAIRHDYGADDSTRFSPGILAQGYVPLAAGFFLRPGLRLSGIFEQPEMPQSLRIEEREVNVGGELGVIYDWVVIPQLSLGTMATFRKSKLVTAQPIVSSVGGIGGQSTLFSFYGQSGVGFPFLDGRVVLEPEFRYFFSAADPRFSYEMGVDLTYGF